MVSPTEEGVPEESSEEENNIIIRDSTLQKILTH